MSKWRAPLWASVFSLLVLAAQLLPALHFMVVQHTRCNTHGELVHGSLHGSVYTTAQDQQGSVDVDDEDDSHEHCGSVFLGTSNCTPSESDGVVLSLERETNVARLRDAFARTISSISLLDLAPKSSPPRA